jgi:Tol biopolymer transport system component
MRLAFLKQSCIAGFIAALLVTSPVSGFGKNKVQYADLSWQALPSSHMTLYFHQNQGALPGISYRLTEEIYRSLKSRFKFTHKDPIPIIIYGSPTLFSQTNVITELLPEEVGGFTELFKTRVVVPFSGSYDDLNHVLHHEMVHAFMYGIFYDRLGSSLMGGGIQIPLWFNEGLAEYLSSGWNVESDMFLMDFAINSEVPPPGPMLGGYMAYKGGQSFLYFLASTYGDSLFTKFLRDFKSSKSLEATIKKLYKKSTEELGKEWIQELKRIYWPEIGRRTDPKKIAAAVTKHIELKNHLNLRPRISPDGKRVAFFSDRYDYTKILITDRKGKVLQTISQNGYGGYFESFHPFRSGMCWSPDGKKLAFVTQNNGFDQIRIVDIDGKKLIKTISTRLSSIVGPDWSRSGSFITFAGIDSGMSNIFLYSFKNNLVTRLTHSVQFNSDPRFSPDDSMIIYTQQDTSCRVDDAPEYAWGATPSAIAVLRPFSDTISERLLTSTPWNEKQPCFSPDGKQVLFVSDRNGIDNLYLAPIDSLGNASPVTDIFGGCSNPDWSADGKDAVFTLFQNLGWDIWLMEKPNEKKLKKSLENTKWIETRLDSTLRYFTPAPKKTDTADTGNTVALSGNSGKQKADTNVGSTDSIGVPGTAPTAEIDSNATPETADPATIVTDSTPLVIADPAFDSAKTGRSVKMPSAEPYRLKFSPDLVAMGVGMSSFYGYAGQWLLSLSDIMGDHRITVAGDVQNDFQSTMHFFGSYLYMKKRINIGGGAYYFKDYVGYGYSDTYFNDAELGGFISASYPFSLFSRLDFECVGRTIERTSRSYDISDSINGQKQTINTLLPSVSYSFDNILWGMTGPLNGMRARATVQALAPLSFIDDPFVSCEIDFRRYFHLFKRFVWANRVFLGASQPLSETASPRRYLLGGSENWIFTSSDINYEQYENNVRYAFYSAMVVPFRGWRYFDISGTKVAVLNSEFRFPFIREFSTVFPLPLAIRYINGAVFADIGNAWDRRNQRNGLPLPEKLYGGLGFGTRINLGIFLLRYDRGWPVDVGTRAYGKPINYFSLGTEF